MINVYFCHEPVAGVSPPVIFIRGTTNDSLKLGVSLLPFLKKKDNKFSTHELPFVSEKTLITVES
jgi:hypothetical protein